MDGQPTRGGFGAPVRATWRDFFAFLRRPVLPERAAGIGTRGFGAIANLFPLDLAAMALLIGSFSLLAALGLHLPGHVLESLKLSPLLVAALVIGAPMAEETVFRGWLSGRPGHVLAILALAAGLAGAIGASQGLAKPTAGLVAFVSLLAGALAAAAFLWLGRRKPAWGWFQRHFRWFYYASALAFASVHLANFIGGNLIALLPLTAPQFVLGLMLGYLRVKHGLWASMALHILHNALFIGLVAVVGR